MPHLIIEHSDNIGSPADSQRLVDAVHQAALGSPIVPLAGLRTRAAVRQRFQVADGPPANAFVAILARLGPGRTASEKSAFLELLLSAVEGAVTEMAPGLTVSYSVEYQEIDAEFRINRNHIRTRLQAEQSQDNEENTDGR